MVIARCPSCGADTGEPVKKWKYRQKYKSEKFDVNAYACPKCGLKFRIYQGDKGTKFVLALKEGKFRKVG